LSDQSTPVLAALARPPCPMRGSVDPERWAGASRSWGSGPVWVGGCGRGADRARTKVCSPPWDRRGARDMCRPPGPEARTPRESRGCSRFVPPSGPSRTHPLRIGGVGWIWPTSRGGRACGHARGGGRASRAGRSGARRSDARDGLLNVIFLSVSTVEQPNRRALNSDWAGSQLVAGEQPSRRKPGLRWDVSQLLLRASAQPGVGFAGLAVPCSWSCSC
jgi:hypothetical protein